MNYSPRPRRVLRDERAGFWGVSISTSIPTTLNGLISYLEFAEIDHRRAPDCRRVLREERFSILAALKRKDYELVKSTALEARRVATMWLGY